MAQPINQTSTSMRELDRRHLWHPYSKHSAIHSEPFPIMTRGRGVHLYDADDRAYIDGISSWWCCNLGHSRPDLVTALQRQSDQLQHSILGNMSHPAAVQLAARLAGIFPTAGRRVHFASDGASAVEAACKIALQYRHAIGEPQRRKFLSFKNGYHGDTLAMVSLGFIDAFHAPFKHMVPRAQQAPAPCPDARHLGIQPHNCTAECLAAFRETFAAHADELAAVVLEPLCQGAAGMQLYHHDALAEIARLCAEHDVLLIADEIATGYGRTGRMFAFEHAGIDPDIVCLGKGLAGGYLPMSATVVTDRIYAAFTDKPEDHTFYHGHTFAGNPIAAATAIAVLDAYRDEDIVERAARAGETLHRQLEAFIDEPGVADVRCLGMIGAVELKDAPSPQLPEACMARGLIIRPLGNVVYLMLPLVAEKKIIVEATDILLDGVRACADSVAD